MDKVKKIDLAYLLGYFLIPLAIAAASVLVGMRLLWFP